MVDLLSPPARRLRPPSWLEPRLLGGLLLVAVSMSIGAKVVSTADESVQVWSVTRDVAVGTVLRADDLRPARVRLFDSAPRYLAIAESPAGRVAGRQLGRGELLPAAALRSVTPGMVVNIPVQPANAPVVERGQTVDVWASSKECGPERLLRAAPIQEVRSDGGGRLSSGAGSLQVVVRVSPAEAERLLTALAAEATIRLVVLAGDVTGGASSAATCLGPREAVASLGGGD